MADNKKDKIPTVQLPEEAIKPHSQAIPASIKGAAEDPKNPANQKSREGGIWAERFAKKYGGRTPPIDKDGQYKLGGQLVTRPGKTRWDQSGGVSAVQQ